MGSIVKSQPDTAPDSASVVSPRSRRRALWRTLVASLVAAPAIAAVWLWLHDGGISSVHSGGELLTTTGRITGLLGAYLLLLQVLLLARLRGVERLLGFDRMTVWHRINGKLCLYMILAHVGFITAGYAAMDRISIPAEINTLVTQYPGMLDAVIGTGLLILVVVSSLVIVRRRFRYEAWYVVHLTAYASIVLAWYHQLPTGNDFILNPTAAMLWTGLYLVTLGLVVLFRLAVPIFYAFRYQLRVAEVNVEGPKVVSLRVTGRHLDRLRVQAGQFFLWRFLTWKLVWESHPFSLSAAPDGQSLRITVKSLGDFTSRIGDMKPGTRVAGVGPFGLFTASERRCENVALIAGGVGITPIRGLLEAMKGDVVLVYRVVSDVDIVFRDELELLARDRGITVHYVTGSHLDPGAERFLSADHLREIMPDIAQHEVYVCGPPGMADSVEASVRQAGVPGKHIHTERFAF
jgi:predicted ferric reductase